MIADLFELTLDVEDRPLRRRTLDSYVRTRKPAREEDACGFGQHEHVLAEVLSGELQYGCFPCAWPTGQDNTFA